jgi:antitoxin ParD1/3/4
MPLTLSLLLPVMWLGNWSFVMSDITLNVRVNGALGDFVVAIVGDGGCCENVSDYLRDLIRKDKERAEFWQFDRLKAELGVAFAAPNSRYDALTAKDLIARNPSRQNA